MARSFRLPNIRGSSARCPLSVMAEFADRPLEKRSITDLLRMADLPREERARQLHETMKVMEFEHKRGVQGIASQDYHILMKSVYDQHRGTMIDIAKGVFEFYEDLDEVFGRVDLADLRQDLRIIQDIEQSLDSFFTERLTLRLLIPHVLSLNSHSADSMAKTKDMVGVVNVNTQPIQILCRAFVAARFICLRDYNVCPNLNVNLTEYEEFLNSPAASMNKFPYVHTHLFYIFLELFKNAARASIERAQADQGIKLSTASSSSSGGFDPDAPVLTVTPIYVTVPEQATWDRERAVKMADRGTGMNRSVLSKAFCYFYSSAESKPKVTDEVSDFDKRVPLAGFGFGLPISRVMARYFNGNIELNSISGNGTDVYIYL